MTEHTTFSLTPSPALLRAVRHVLRPLVRLLIRWGVGFPQLSDLLKEVYVEVADSDFTYGAKPNSDSRVTLLTGVHRKDVRRLRGAPTEVSPGSASLGARLVAMWLADPAYSQDGQPKPVLRHGPVPSFEHLVETVSRGDLRARVMFEELERQGAVKLEGEYVSLLMDAFVPSKSLEEKAFFFGKNIHDHIAAADHNLQGGAPPMFDRSVYYNNLSPASIEEISQLANEQASALLKVVNVIAREKQRQDHTDPASKQRFNLGVFYWVEKQPTEHEESASE
ncbi:MAG TPA: DUF6502 family protein [Pseudomonadales bacterium]|nr:DUF6502 family protein [Pseudomonadales bacterium]